MLVADAADEVLFSLGDAVYRVCAADSLVVHAQVVQQDRLSVDPVGLEQADLGLLQGLAREPRPEHILMEVALEKELIVVPEVLEHIQLDLLPAGLQVAAPFMSGRLPRRNAGRPFAALRRSPTGQLAYVARGVVGPYRSVQQRVRVPPPHAL